MNNFIFSILMQSLTFLPLALAISISYHILRATDMTLDGSFVLGAALFGRLVTLGVSPAIAFAVALCGGALAGIVVANIQRGGKVDPLLAGVLASFMLSSINLIVMGKPNINLLLQHTLVSNAFDQSNLTGWILTGVFVVALCAVAAAILQSRVGLLLRAFGDNPQLFKRQGRNIELYRMFGFGLTNLLAAGAGCLTAQTVGYADIGMGFGMTLTGIGAIILGQQLMLRVCRERVFRLSLEILACIVGVTLYFFAVNFLLRVDVDPLYLKLILGLFLIIFLRLAIYPARGVN